MCFRLQQKTTIKFGGSNMNRWRIFLSVTAFFILSGVPALARSTDPAPQSQDVPPNTAARGTRFLISLQTRISTKEDEAGKPLLARTLEPIPTVDGTVLPRGTEVRGHIDKIQSAGKAGRARMWLTFDDIRTSSGWTPLVADLVDAPGVHSIRVLFDHEGEIEAATGKRQDEMIAAAEAALAGAAPGIAAKDKKDAAEGAAMGAATGFMTSSGLGQELTLEQNMKLELILQRPLYIGKT
jgi:hypothetical protein